jgi:AcrR family transcriptional regulator
MCTFRATEVPHPQRRISPAETALACMRRDRQPSLCVVAQDDCAQLMVVFAAVVYERGFAATGLSDVADRAGVPLSAVQAWWPGEVDWLLETVAASTRRLFGQMAEAALSVEGDAPLALHHALATMLRELAGAPEMTYLSVVELPSLGPLLHARRERMLHLFSTFLDPGVAALDHPSPSPEAISLSITGGLWELVRRYALERRLHELPDALPAISHLCLSTFFGIDEAGRVAALGRRALGRRDQHEEHQRAYGLDGG